jgi:hypothetical protein
MKKILTLSILLISIAYCQAQKSLLILTLEKDVEYIQSTHSEATIDQDINGQKMHMVMDIKGTMSYLVKSVDGEGFNMDVAYRSLNMSMQLPQGTMEFSSEKQVEGDIFSSILSQMKHKVFQVRMTKYGKITEVKNIETLFESAFSNIPEIPAAQLAQIKTQLLKAYGEEAFKGNIEMVTAIYPNEKVKSGDDWVINTQLESGMSANVTTTYKFVDSTKEHYLITGKSIIKTADKDAYIETNGMPMKFDLTGSMISAIKIDKKSGWIVDAKINQDIQGDTFIKANPQIPEGMKIPMVMKSVMVFSNH